MRLGIYQHYNGKYYQVIGVARHSETLEPMVIYQALYDGYGLWARPATMFEEKVSIDGQERPRFMFIAENLVQLPTLK